MYNLIDCRKLELAVKHVLELITNEKQIHINYKLYATASSNKWTNNENPKHGMFIIFHTKYNPCLPLPVRMFSTSYMSMIHIFGHPRTRSRYDALSVRRII